jgi:hypothetical protein
MPAEAASELLRRRRARARLIDFTCYTKPDYRVWWHHEAMAAKLDDVAAGRSRRVMFFFPPQHGKSELVSRRFPPYALGRSPGLRIINCSHTYDKAVEMNRDMQRILDSPEYRRLFPDVRMADYAGRGPVRRTMDYFELVGHSGSVRSAGVGNSVAGSAADGVIIDDPFGKQEDAESPTIREKIWNWYTHDIYSRLATDAWIIVTHTRWNRDDLAGRLLEKMADRSGDQWEIINLPAIKPDKPGDQLDRRQPGEALWPAFKDVAALEIVRAQDLRAFASLYQQDPLADGATEWPDEWFKDVWFDEWPAGDRGQRVLSLDSSKGKGGKSGDYSAFVKILFYDDVLWVDADLRNDRNAEALAATMLEMQRDWKPHAASCEEEFGGPVLKALVANMAAARKMLVPDLFLIGTGGVPKPVRIRRLTPWLAGRRFRFKSSSPGVRLLVQQLKDFPHGDHDDGPDALEMGMRLLVEGGVVCA